MVISYLLLVFHSFKNAVLLMFVDLTAVTIAVCMVLFACFMFFVCCPGNEFMSEDERG